MNEHRESLMSSGGPFLRCLKNLIELQEGIAPDPEPVKGTANALAPVPCAAFSERPVPAIDVHASQHQGEGAEPSAADSIGLDELFSKLWCSKAILLAGALLGMAGMLAVSLLLRPVYRARTSIRLEELNERFPNLPEMLSSHRATAGEIDLQNELKIFESDSLAKHVAGRLGINPVFTPSPIWTKPPFENLRAPFLANRLKPTREDLQIGAVQRALSIRPSLKSNVIDIFFDSTDPSFAAKGADAVVAEYIAMNHEGRMQITKDDTEWLAAQISDLKQKLDQGNEQLQAFARASGLLYAANQSLLSEEKVRDVQEELSKAQAARAATESSYEAAVSHSPEALPVNADNGLLRDYEGKLAAVQQELTQLRSLYTPAHYKVVEAEARAAQVQSTINAERQRIIARMRAQFDAAKRLEDSLKAAYSANTRELTQQTAAAFRYNVMKRDLDSTELLYNSLLQKAKEAGVTSAMRATSVRVIDPARPPSTPYSPNLPLNGSIGFSAGLMLAAGIVLIRKRDVYSSVDAGRHEVPVRELGKIPFARAAAGRRWPPRLFAGEAERVGVELVTWYDQPSVLTEAFRSAIASIVLSPAFGRRNHLLLTVTSAQPREGKTTAVSNLGIALAETHGRVLLIDADLRRPRIHSIFGQCNDSGLSTVLAGSEPIAALDFGRLARKTDVPGLFTLPSGPGAPSITPLLYSARMSAFLTRARKEFDYVLIDTPPASLFSDARILGRHSDGVIVVIHAAKAMRSELNMACVNFVKDGTPIVGSIVNHAAEYKNGYDNYRQKPA
jgi:polysaccharide biosynthesis transport protein